MLKLTHSFCRSLKFTCERINSTSVNKFSHFTRTSCLESIQNIPSTLSIIYLEPQLRLFANIRKKNRLKKLCISLNESKTSQKMSQSLQPNLNHASYGGRFEISSTDNQTARRGLENYENSNYGDDINKKQPIPPNFRVWEKVVKKINTSDGACRFTVVSYNVLAQALLECHSYLYRECSPHDLKWEVRAARLYDEIVSLAPDILCLQEVQESHLSTFYSKFEKIGYFGTFKKKTGNKLDGCAIYFKQSVFDLQDQLSVEFYQPQMPILNRDNIGLMVKLAPKSSPATPIVVATTHLLYNPRRTEVRLAQIQVLLAEIDRFAYHNDNNGCGGHLPIILTGDCNSLPQSAVVLLLDRGRVSAAPFRDQSDWQRIGITDNSQHLAAHLNSQHGQRTDFSMTKIYHSEYSENASKSPCPNPVLGKCDYSHLFNGAVIGHPLKLTSVYSRIKKDGHCEATTYQDNWVTVDYIYYSGLRLVERLRLPTGVECAALGSLPNEAYGSDHLALAAVFELRRAASL